MPCCKVCGRKLTDAESIRRGCGPVCESKRSIGVIQLELNFTPLFDPKLSDYEKYKIASKLMKSWD